MSFDAGSEPSVYCDGCDKSVHDGSRVYCRDCATNGIPVLEPPVSRATMPLVSVSGTALAEWRDDEILSLSDTERSFLDRVIESMNTGVPYAVARRLAMAS